MPDAYGVYSNMTVFEYLDFYGRSFGFGKIERAQRVAEVMEFADLGPIADRMMDKLSKGMGQRLCLGPHAPARS
jgi:ABC-2 type transport system ATP-binding protein